MALTKTINLSYFLKEYQVIRGEQRKRANFLIFCCIVLAVNFCCLFFVYSSLVPLLFVFVSVVMAIDLIHFKIADELGKLLVELENQLQQNPKEKNKRITMLYS
jgi:fatty acid desaturase